MQIIQGKPVLLRCIVLGDRMRHLLWIVLTVMLAGCAEVPVSLEPINNAQFQSKEEAQKAMRVAQARCSAVAMNSMGPPANPTPPRPQQQVDIRTTAVAQSTVVLNGPRPPGQVDWDASPEARRISDRVEKARSALAAVPAPELPKVQTATAPTIDYAAINENA